MSFGSKYMQWQGGGNVGEHDKVIACATCKNDIKKICSRWSGKISPQECLYNGLLEQASYRDWKLFNINLMYAYWEPIHPEKSEPLEKELFEI